jgi:hypothetical protein
MAAVHECADELESTLSALTAEAGKGEVTDAMVDSVRADIMQSAAADGHTHVVIKDEWVRDALEAALSTATPAGEWVPIESAPKDQRIVMAYFGDDKKLDGFACIGHFFQWECMPGPLPTGWPWRTLPTHWTPLAASPRGASAGEG